MIESAQWADSMKMALKTMVVLNGNFPHSCKKEQLYDQQLRNTLIAWVTCIENKAESFHKQKLIIKFLTLLRIS